MSNIGDYIRERREAADYSQERLAEESGVGQDSTISRIEKGTRKITLDELAKIADVLGFSMLDILIATGYISEKEVQPERRLHFLEKLNDDEFQAAQTFVDFLIYQKEMQNTKE